MTEPRLHHHVSQCYLKGFTQEGTKDSQLYAVNLSDGSSFCTIPKNVGAERDFNRVEGRPPGEIERALSGFEGKVDAALRRIRQTRSIDNPKDWNAVLNLMALFAVRNPRMRENVHTSIDHMSRIIMDMALATPERWESQVQRMKAAGAMKGEPRVGYDELKKFHEEGNYNIEVSIALHIAQEFKIQDTILRTMADRRWLLCSAKQDSGGFLTSDHPVCLMHSDGTPPTFQRPIGHGMRNSTVIFPLGNELLAVGTFEGSGGVRLLSPLQVAHMNGVVCAYAERQIYARDETFRVWGGKKRGPMTSVELTRLLAVQDASADQTSS